MMLEAFVQHQGTKPDQQDGQWYTLGVFEMAAGRDMDSQTFKPHGTYERQAEHFRRKAQREYSRPVILRPVSA
jgi:hypothetical protein